MPPTSTRKAIRQKLLRRVDSPAFPITSTTTAAGSTTTLKDSVLAPTAQTEDYIRAWVYCASQDNSDTTDSGENINEGGTFTATDTTLTVDTGGTFAAGEMIKIESEVLFITAISGNDLTVVRGVAGTTAVSHADATDVFDLDGTAIGEIARITNVDFSGSNSTLTIAPAFKRTMQSLIDYEVHRTHHPSILHQVIDDVLDELEHPTLFPLTLISDGDMEDDPASNFTAVNATLTNETSTVLHGRQSLKVAATSASGSALSGEVNIPSNTEILVAADVYITNGDSAKLILDTGATTVLMGERETAESAATGWTHLEFRWTTGSDQEKIRIYLVSQANTDITYWDNLIVIPTKQVAFEYPSKLEFSDELVKVMYFDIGSGLSNTGDDKAYKLLEKPAKFWSHATIERDETAIVPYRVQLDRTPISRPLWVEGRIDFAAFSGGDESTKDLDTTKAPKELVVELAYGKLLDMKAQEAQRNGDTNSFSLISAMAEDVRRKIVGEYRAYNTNRGLIRGSLR